MTPTPDAKRPPGFGKRLRKLTGRVAMFVWILICVFCWFVAVRSFWRSDWAGYSITDTNPELKGRHDLWYLRPSGFIYLSSTEGAVILGTRWEEHLNPYWRSTQRFERRWFYESQNIQLGISTENSVYMLEDYRYPPVKYVGDAPRWLVPAFSWSRSRDIGRDEDSYRAGRFWLRLPWWLILAILHTPLPFILRAKRKRYRRENGLCLTCGYDLRSSSGRCSECGRVIS